VLPSSARSGNRERKAIYGRFHRGLGRPHLAESMGRRSGINIRANGRFGTQIEVASFLKRTPALRFSRPVPIQEPCQPTLSSEMSGRGRRKDPAIQTGSICGPGISARPG